MAKLFRKIRQKLLTENRLRKYLSYAIGEIVLVVIGILIALQINTLNQDRQRAKLEKVLLNQVKFEILEIYADIWRDVGVLSLGNRSHYAISKYIAEDKPYSDSLCFSFYWLKEDEYVYPTNAAYSKLKEEGLDIIKNDKIRTLLQSLYEGHFPRLLKNNTFAPDISMAFNDYYLNSFKPNSDLSLVFNYELPDDNVGSRIYTDVIYSFPKIDSLHEASYTRGYVPLDFEALKKDSKFHMLLEQTKRYRDNRLMHYSYAKSIIKDLIPLIEQEYK